MREASQLHALNCKHSLNFKCHWGDQSMVEVSLTFWHCTCSIIVDGYTEWGVGVSFYGYMFCRLNAVSISEDSSLLAGSFSDSIVRVWTLTPKKLCPLKTPAQMQLVTLAAGKSLHGYGMHECTLYILALACELSEFLPMWAHKQSRKALWFNQKNSNPQTQGSISALNGLKKRWVTFLNDSDTGTCVIQWSPT